jgi:hypothetical protein
MSNSAAVGPCACIGQLKHWKLLLCVLWSGCICNVTYTAAADIEASSLQSLQYTAAAGAVLHVLLQLTLMFVACRICSTVLQQTALAAARHLLTGVAVLLVV